MARYLGIAGVQMEVVAGADNMELVMKRLKSVAAQFPWVDVVLLSELCVQGLNPALGEPIPDARIERLCGWAERERKWLIPGSFFERDGDKLYNTSIAISPLGKIAVVYRKLFP